MRFENQGDTQQHLEAVKHSNDKQITRLREEREKLNEEFEEMKYSGEAKLSRYLGKTTEKSISVFDLINVFPVARDC